MFPKLHILVRPASLPSSPQEGRGHQSTLCTTHCALPCVCPLCPWEGGKRRPPPPTSILYVSHLQPAYCVLQTCTLPPQLSPCLHQDQNLGYAGRVREGPTTTAPAACKYLGCGHCLQAVPEEKGVPLNHQEERGEGPGEG